MAYPHLGALTTHVLDTVKGGAARGVRVELWSMEGAPRKIAETLTDQDGRGADVLLPEQGFPAGAYELRFHIGDYFALPPPRYLDVVVVRVTLAPEQGHYHVPILVSHWSYSTYRGS